MSATDTLVTLTAPVELQAAAGDKPARVAILAYGGGVMSVAGFGSLVVDLAGLAMPESVPLLADHLSDLRGVAGVVRPRIEAGERLWVEGTLVRSSEQGARIISLSAEGVPLQASIGAEAGERQHIKAGATVNVNGQTLTAGPRGFTLIRTAQLREVSVLPLGADSSTTVAVSARRGPIMDPQTVDLAVSTLDPPDGATAERERVKAIRSTCDGVGFDTRAVEDEAINSGWTPEQCSARVLEMLRARRVIEASSFSGRGRSAMTRETLEASLLIRAGREELAVKSYGANVAEQGRALRITSLLDLAAAALRLDGRDTAGLSRSDVIQAAVSTLSLPNALANTMGRALLPAYAQATATWRGWARVMPAADFKDQTALRPSLVENLEKLGDGGEVKHATLSESAYTWRIDQYARMFTIGRKTLINDDLGFLTQMPELLAKAAANTLNDLVYSTWIGNSGSYFHTNNSNTGSGALSETTFGAAMAALRSQRDASGRDLSIVPKVLLVPPELEATALGITTSDVLGPSDGSPTINVWKKVVDVAVESRLTNTLFSGYDTDAWYLIGGPEAAAFIIGFLDGRETPIIETFGLDTTPNRLEMSFRAIHDFGVAYGDPKAAQRRTGA